MVDIERRHYVAFLRGVPERLMSTSEDFVHWSPPRPFLAPLNEEEALYNNTGFNYGAHYLGILTHFDKRPRQQTQVLRLLCSRDGRVLAASAGGATVGFGRSGRVGSVPAHAQRCAAHCRGRQALHLLPGHGAATRQNSARIRPTDCGRSGPGDDGHWLGHAAPRRLRVAQRQF